MRRTILLASILLIVGGAAHAQSQAAGGINAGAKAIIESYENGCSKHEKGSADYLKCRSDGYKEVSSNCQQLQQMTFDPKKATTSGVKQKLDMWCGAKQHYNDKR